MKLKQVIECLPAVERELKKVIEEDVNDDVPELRSMLRYHMGWEGERAGLEAQGKRIRPLLVLLSVCLTTTSWETGLPASASVELVHNFSLIHDDIQDCSETRRGRPTVWKKWGIAQAINAGDLMFTLAFSSLDRMRKSTQAGDVLQAHQVLQKACIELTHGQYLDIAFERRGEISLEDYWAMISRKTGALLAASMELGAVSAQVPVNRRPLYCEFGKSLGMAYQVWDDWLGIWGDSQITGKSTASDLLTGKKTLPVLYALHHCAEFRERWLKGPVQADEIPMVSRLMVEAGAKEFTEKETRRLTADTLAALDQISGDQETSEALSELTSSLVGRKF